MLLTSKGKIIALSLLFVFITFVLCQTFPISNLLIQLLYGLKCLCTRETIHLLLKRLSQ